MVQKKWLEGEFLDSDENVAEKTPFWKAIYIFPGSVHIFPAEE